LRREELKAEKKIADAKQKSQNIINRANNEGLVSIEEALKLLRAELEKNYRKEEQKIQKESEKIVAEAKSNVGAEQSTGRAKIPAAVESVIKKILGGI
jgi:vacuolar-type H+-ATPase subunit H